MLRYTFLAVDKCQTFLNDVGSYPPQGALTGNAQGGSPNTSRLSITRSGNRQGSVVYHHLPTKSCSIQAGCSIKECFLSTIDIRGLSDGTVKITYYIGGFYSLPVLNRGIINDLFLFRLDGGGVPRLPGQAPRDCCRPPD